MVEPVDSLGRGVLDVVQVLPVTLLAAKLGLEAADDRLGEGLVAGIATGADRGGHDGFC